MITVLLRGGLGNQMFQYAAGLGLAIKNNVPLALDTTVLNDRFPRKEFTYRTFDLDLFTLSPRFTTLSRISSNVPVPGLWAGLDLAGIGARKILRVQKVIFEKEPHVFDPVISATIGDIMLIGRWQNEKYFSDIESDIREAFQFRYPLEGRAKELKEEIVSSQSVALCVRRGDFVNFESVKEMMGDTNVSYYNRAVAYINKRVKNPSYFVFADDVEFCKKNLELPSSTVYIDKLGPKWSFHLELMSLCRHSIITNSTFYWWGAWLNPNSDGIVITPARWYVDRETQPEIASQGWIKM